MKSKSSIPQNNKHLEINGWCQDILETLGTIVYKLDSSGKFVYVNNSVIRLGYSPQDLIGRHFSVIIHPDDRESVSRDIVLPKYQSKKTGDDESPLLFDERRAGLRMTNDLEIRLIPKGWDTTHEENDDRIAAVVILGTVSATGHYETIDSPPRQKFTGTIGLIRDLTDHKDFLKNHLRGEIQKSLNVLFKEGMHGFNKELIALSGHISMAKAELKTFPSGLEHLLHAEERCRHVMTLSDQLQTFFKGDTPHFASISAKRIIETCAGIIIHNPSVQYSLEIAGDLTNIQADALQMTVAVSNILVHAVRATTSGGVIRIHASNTVLTADNAYSLVPGNYVLISVQDDGAGIPPQKLDRIFTPYSTTRGKKTGAGLAVSFAIIKNHKGVLSAESEIGKGSIFTIVLPAAALSEKSTIMPTINNLFHNILYIAYPKTSHEDYYSFRKAIKEIIADKQEKRNVVIDLEKTGNLNSSDYASIILLARELSFLGRTLYALINPKIKDDLTSLNLHKIPNMIMSDDRNTLAEEIERKSQQEASIAGRSRF